MNATAMTAAESMHAYLESLTPQVRRAERGPVTIVAPLYDVIARGDVDLAIKYPSDVVSVTTSEDRDSFAPSIVFCYKVRIEYADGRRADGRFPSCDRRARDELALVMRAMMEAAKA